MMVFAAALLLIAYSSSGRDLPQIIDQARTKPITPKAQPPKSFDWKRVQRAYKLATLHKDSLENVLAMVSLPTTFACRDIVPILIHTGQLVNNYDRRMDATGRQVSQLYESPNNRADFIKKNCMRAYQLGEMHLNLSKSIKAKDLGWNSKERIPFSQQAFSLTFYTFAWEPIEAMEATKELNAKTDARQINDWIYLWDILGRSLGVEDDLLPHNSTRAQRIVAALRKKQYYVAAQRDSKDVDVLLHNHVLYICHVMAPDKPIDNAQKEKACKALVGFMSSSPGLVDALGLSPDPVSALTHISPGN